VRRRREKSTKLLAKSVSGRFVRKTVHVRSASRLNWPSAVPLAVEVAADAVGAGAGAEVEIEIEIEIEREREMGAETETETATGPATETGARAEVAPSHATVLYR
jgi:hypothetical protein